MLNRNSRIKPTILNQMATQWQLLTVTGIPLDQTFDLLSEGFNDNKELKPRLTNIRKQLQQGSSLYDAFRQHSPYFPDLFVQLIQAGERSGDLATTLGHTATYYEKLEQFRKKTIQALTYPIITLGVAFFIILFMLFFVIPAFADIYKTTNTQIPGFTQFLIDTSSFLESNIHFIVPAFFTLIMIIYFSGNFIRELFLKTVIALPVLNEYIRISFQARFSYSMYILLSNAIPLLDALKITERISDLTQYKREVNFLLHVAKKGEFFSGFKKKGLIFTPLLMAMMKTGEQTAHLDEIFSQLASYYQQQLDHKTSTLLAIMEPTIILILGLIIGAIVVALYIPMFEISSGLGG